MRPSGQPLRASDTNPKVKNLYKGQSAVPLNHNTPKGGPKGPSMITIAQTPLLVEKLAFFPWGTPEGVLGIGAV